MRQKAKRYLNFRIKTERLPKKADKMRYVWIVLCVCFIVGIIFANIMEREQLSGFGIWNTYFIEKFKYANIQSSNLFYYILEVRFPVLILLLLFAVTNWGMAAGTLFWGWQGFAAGFLMAASILTYGLKGVLLAGTAVFPHYLLYIPLYIAYLYLASFWKEKVLALTPERIGGHRKDYVLFLTISLLMISIYVTGIFLESYVNPYLFKKILKFF